MPKTADLEYKIDAKMLDKLWLVRKRLKRHTEYRSSIIAGLCLLGMKDNVIDSFVPILASRGCADSPQVSHKLFNEAFVKMISNDRITVGMALIRPENCAEQMSTDLEGNIRKWKNTFKDISKTIWLIVSDKNIIPYKVALTKDGRLSTVQVTEKIDKIYNNIDYSMLLKMMELERLCRKEEASIRPLLKGHITKLKNAIENGSSAARIVKGIDNTMLEIDDIKKEKKREERLRKQRAERQRKKKELETKEKKAAADRRKRAKTRREKAANKDVTDIGNGYCLIKQKNGTEILWTK